MFQYGTKPSEMVSGFSFRRALCSKARNMLGNHIWPYGSNKLCKRLLTPLKKLGIKCLFWQTQLCSRMPFGVGDCTQIEFLQVQRLTPACLNPPPQVFVLFWIYSPHLFIIYLAFLFRHCPFSAPPLGFSHISYLKSVFQQGRRRRCCWRTRQGRAPQTPSRTPS